MSRLLLQDQEITITQRRLIELSQKHSRRGLLAKTMKLMLAVAGVSAGLASITELRPLPAEASHQCGYSYNCGLCGYNCADCGGSPTSCPSGSASGNASWAACCNNEGSWNWWNYYDCCAWTGSGGCGSKCTNNCPQGTWCPQQGQILWCNLAIYGGPC
jgi:hypothetical protein